MIETKVTPSPTSVIAGLERAGVTEVGGEGFSL